MKPNQVIKESFKKTLSVLFLCIPFLIPFYFLVSLLLDESIDFQSIISALLLGLSFSLLTGSINLIQHLTLRLILWQQGLIPRNYAHFLDYTAERKLIHRIGGKYRFLYDSLRKYLASQVTITKRVR